MTSYLSAATKPKYRVDKNRKFRTSCPDFASKKTVNFFANLENKIRKIWAMPQHLTARTTAEVH